MEVCFRFPRMCRRSPIRRWQCRINFFVVVMPPDSRFMGEVGEVKLHLLVILSGYTALVGPHYGH